MASISNIIKLSRSLSQDEIWHRILEINIKALESLLEENDNDINRWRFLLTNYQSSVEETRENAKLLKEILENQYKKPGISITFLRGISSNWLNTFKSTLYMMEEDLIENSPEGVFNLWDLFFRVEEERGLTYSKSLKLNMIYYGNEN
jgi:hypothetical protein